jgi:hypothetical protein
MRSGSAMSSPGFIVSEIRNDYEVAAGFRSKEG